LSGSTTISDSIALPVVVEEVAADLARRHTLARDGVTGQVRVLSRHEVHLQIVGGVQLTLERSDPGSVDSNRLNDNDSDQTENQDPEP
jgi:hypothetical protein